MMLVIDRRTALVRYEAKTLVLESRDGRKWRVPLQPLDHVLILDNPLVEARVWRHLAEADVSVAVLPGRGRGEVALLGHGLAAQLPLRRRQHRCATDPEQSLALARWFVRAKLLSYPVALEVLADRLGAPERDLKTFLDWRDRALERLRAAKTYDQLMGLEGGVARTWFALLARHLPKKWRFSGRNRQPPRDPVNALLSLGYTLLFAEVRRVVLAYGLDPALGFLHQVYPGRESMALDFVEIFRSGVDALVLRLIAEDPFGREGFYYREAEGCRLSAKGRPHFFRAWAVQRERWPHPFGEGEAAPLWERIGGQIQRFRQTLDEISDEGCAPDDGKATATTVETEGIGDDEKEGMEEMVENVFRGTP